VSDTKPVTPLGKLLRPRLIHVIGAALATFAAGCGRAGGTWQMPEQASLHAADVDWMYYYIFWLCVFYFAHIMAMLGWFAWKYRRRPGHEPQPSPHHSLVLEVAWTIPPVLLTITMFWWGFTTYMDMSTPPSDAYKVEVTAKKWDWTFTYPNGASDTILHVPPDQSLQVLLESTDVLHAFYIPAMRVKKDIVPGRTTSLWFQANMKWLKEKASKRTGDDAKLPYLSYTLYCAEYCGTSHSRMRAQVRVYLTRAAFEKVITDINVETPGKLYDMNCRSCHTTNGNPSIGPTFQGIFGSQRKVYDPATKADSTITADEAYLRESILEPGKLLSRVGKDFDNQMEAQAFGDKLKPKQLDMLIDFLKDPERKSWDDYDYKKRK
jgi:cytochrome c oxidase subunit 2